MTLKLPTLRLALGLVVLPLGLISSAQAQGRPSARPTTPPTAVTRPAAGTAVAPTGNAVLGQAKADSERCIECHGPRGEGAGHSNGPEGKFPRLAAQQPDYLLKQLQDFRSGARKHDVMSLMAGSVELADLRDIVAYFASQPATAGDGSHDPAGERLYLEGDPARRLPACAGCHGVQAQGSPATAATPMPRLRAQEFSYLERQLLDWRSGWRRNSADGVMNAAVAGLSEAEIRQLALYLSGLR